MIGTTSLVFAGVGGQGVLLIAELTALAAARAGFDVKQTEVHGVSQRGGSVESHVRFGEAVYSPLVMAGRADVVIGLEKLEALRFAHFVRLPAGGSDGEPDRGGVLIVNDHEIVPGSVAGAADKYPYRAIDVLRDKGLRLMALSASQSARDLGDGRMANVVALGALSTLLMQVSQEVWMETLNERIPEKHRGLNLKAFETGRDLALAQTGESFERRLP
jgi:indolepyruvate ferredoxin oxidoreductase beta subunit